MQCSDEFKPTRRHIENLRDNNAMHAGHHKRRDGARAIVVRHQFYQPETTRIDQMLHVRSKTIIGCDNQRAA